MASTFTLARATEADVPGIVDVWYHAFNSPGILHVFPDSKTGRQWAADSVLMGLRDSAQSAVYMIMTEDNEATGAEKRVVAYSRWIVHRGGGPVPGFEKRWPMPLAPDMAKAVVGDCFFLPMDRQHEKVMGSRAHYYLEVIATHEGYRRRGLASTLLRWGCKAADGESMESYLDAVPGVVSLYEKYRYVAQPEEVRDEKTQATPMLRLAKTISDGVE